METIASDLGRHLKEDLQTIIYDTSSGKSFGWGDVNRILISGSTDDTLSSKVLNLCPPIFGLYTVLNPLLILVISLLP